MARANPHDEKDRHSAVDPSSGRRSSAYSHHHAAQILQPEDETLSFIRATALERGLPPIRLAALDARHLEILVRLMGARKAVEIGTHGGYSGVSIARGLRAGGMLHTFELDPHYAEIARQSFARARLLAEVSVHVGPALENLPSVANQAPFDLVYIADDPERYPRYLSWATDHLRVGGAVIAEQVGGIERENKNYDLRADRAALGLAEFNRVIATSGRFRSTILPSSEGLTVAIKIS
jgi:caffeoyl-CoA O-methyltransferase